MLTIHTLTPERTNFYNHAYTFYRHKTGSKQNHNKYYITNTTYTNPEILQLKEIHG